MKKIFLLIAILITTLSFSQKKMYSDYDYLGTVDILGQLNINGVTIETLMSSNGINILPTQVAYSAIMTSDYTEAQPNRYVIMAGNGTYETTENTDALTHGKFGMLDIYGTGTITLKNSNLTNKVITVTGVMKQVYWKVDKDNNLFWYQDENDGGAGGSTPFSTTIGNGVLTTIPVAHNLGTTNIASVLIYEIATGEIVFPQSIIVVDANTINVIFGVAPTTNQYNITVSSGTGGGVGSGDFLANGTVPMTGELNLDANSIGNTIKTYTGTGNTIIDLRDGNVQKFNFGGQNENISITPPTKAGIYKIIVQQDGVGNRTFTYGTDTFAPSAILPVLSTEANAIDIIEIIYDETNLYIKPDGTSLQAVAGIDLQAPSTVVLSLDSVGETTANLSWTAATDNVGVTNYRVYKDAVLEATLGNVLNYQSIGLTASTSYDYTVTALDAAGNESVISNIITATTTAGIGADAFIMEMTTTTPSEQVDFVTGAFSGAQDFDIDWGDGTVENITGTNGFTVTHTYAAAGVYDVIITGASWKGVGGTSANTGDITEIKQWGTATLFAMKFQGSSNLTITATDTPNFTNVTQFGVAGNLADMFNECTSLTEIPNFNTWDFTGIVNMDRSFRSTSLTAAGLVGLGSINTASLVNAELTFSNSPLALNHDLSAWNIGALVKLTSFNNVTGNGVWSNVNYSATLIGWAAQAPSIQSNVNFFADSNATYNQTVVDSGTTNGTTVGKLVDSTQNFTATVTVGDIIRNTTDGTFAEVLAIDSDTQLTIENDIMVSGEGYVVQNSAVAKARYVLVNDYSWTISDGGGI